MNTNSGLCWSNRENKGDPWSLHLGYIVVMHDQAGDIPALRERFRDSPIDIRYYCENWTALNPEAWADYIVWHWSAYAKYRVGVCAWNEFNLASEGHPGGARDGRVVPDVQCYRDANAWALRVIERLAKTAPTMEFWYGALSQGHSDDQLDTGTGYIAPGYVGLELLGESLRHPFVHGVHAHNYWNNASDVLSEWYGMRHHKLRKFMRADQDLRVSEYGSYSMEGYRTFLEHIDVPAAAFIWYTWDERQNDGSVKVSPWNLCDKPDKVELLRNPPEKAGSTAPPVPSDPPAPPVGDGDVAVPPWITISRYTGSGPHWRLREIWYRGTGDPDNDGTTNVRIIAFHKDGSPAVDIIAMQMNGGYTPRPFSLNGSGQAQADFNMTDDSNFNPERGEVGPYSVWIGDERRVLSDKVSGMGLPMLQHHQVWLIYQETDAPSSGSSLEQAAQNAAVQHRPWMAINTGAALYKYAQQQNLGYPQTDEYEFAFEGRTFVGQVFNLGIVYSEKGDWKSCRWVKKPGE